MHTRIQDLIGSIEPYDDLERIHQKDALAWLESTDDVFRRVSSPPEPAKHLVSYFLLVDPAADLVLLGEHRKSGLWLPSGGHVEPGEDPVETVRRECLEELGVEATFHPTLGERPHFVTVTATRADRPEQHTDVSLWFVLAHDSTQPLQPDPREYHGVRWWRPAEIDVADPMIFDPHQPRMLAKLAATTERV